MLLLLLQKHAGASQPVWRLSSHN